MNIIKTDLEPVLQRSIFLLEEKFAVVARLVSERAEPEGGDYSDKIFICTAPRPCLSHTVQQADFCQVITDQLLKYMDCSNTDLCKL